MTELGAYDFFSHLRYLMIEVNSSCNLACQYCNRPQLEKNGLRNPKNLSPEEFREMLEPFRDCPIDTIKLEGLSEPMLHPQFAALAEILRSYFPKAFVIIATNLQYRVEKTPFLETLPFVDMVYLSIDGIEDTFERLRTGARWKTLCRSLEDIERSIDPKIRASKLHINFTLTEENYQELPAIYELRDRFGLASVRINLAQNWNDDEVSLHTFGSDLLQFLERYRADVKGVGGWEYQDCFWPFHGIVVDVFGDVRQCIINTSMPAIGNIYRDNIREVYNAGKHYNATRRLLLENSPGSNCRTCDYHRLSATLEKFFGGKYQGNLPRRDSYVTGVRSREGDRRT